MNKYYGVIAFVLLLVLVFTSSGLAGSFPSGAEALSTPTPKPVGKSAPQVVSASYAGISRPLRSLAPIKVDPNAPSLLRKMQDRLVIPKTRNGLKNGGRDASIVQNSPVGKSMPASIANFEGVNNVSGVLPPDTQGDIGNDPATGKKYYVQWVNLAFQIWDVTIPAAPVSLYGPAAGNTLWAGTGTICASQNDGDPITQFDHLANRWMMSQFAPSFPDNFHQCIAVSASADPMGAWYLYDFQTSTTLFNDYPHFGVWPDGYYMTVNQFNGTTDVWEGAGVAVFERTVMLSGGLGARMIYIDTGPATANSYGGMLPSDLDGPAPAVGTPNYFMEWDDSTWLGDPTDTLRIWQFHTDWAIPANTTFGANASYDPNLKIATTNVDPNMCGYARSCIPQPGTAQGLDAISDRLMYRLQYRNFGSYQTLVSNHTVDANGADKAGIHWFELRNTGAGFAMNQQGVYAPDTDNRWVGSAAMDASGDIALGYSVSSSATYPSIRYTGRLSADPVNTLPQGEASLVAGAGSQTHTAARWGDYSMMAVDASDGCTFWYTTEYYATTSSAGWQTRIGSFKFPSCGGAPPPSSLSVYLPLIRKDPSPTPTPTPIPPPPTFYSIADAGILQGRAGTNFGSTTDMLAGYDDYLNPDGQIARSLVKFNLSAIPTGTSINNATLYLYYVEYYDYPNYSRTITTYRIGSSWSEGSVTWNTQPAIGESYGSSSIIANSSWGWVSFDVTNLVRAWVNGSQTNNGIMLRGPEWSGADSSWRGFSTREGGIVPYLSIAYTGSSSITPQQPPFESTTPGANSILQILTGQSFNPSDSESCLNTLDLSNATKCLMER